MRSGGRWQRAVAYGLAGAGLSWLCVAVWRGGFDAADPIASVLGAGAGVLAWLAGFGNSGTGAAIASDPPPPAAPEVPGWVVDRTEADRVISIVCTRRRTTGPVGLTTALEGAGGFGKTTLATLVCASPKVKKHFQGRVYFVTVGRSVRGRAAIAAKVAEVTRFVTGDTTSFDDPELAGAHFGRLLDQRARTLLVLDDVWEQEQLAPFLLGGADCVRIVTTRIPAVLPDNTERIQVDQMSPDQAYAVLTNGLPNLPNPINEGLLAATGRWALLLRLTNRIIATRIASGTDPDIAASETLRRLQDDGPVGVDDPAEAVDLDNPKRRSTAVRSTVEAATRLLPAGGYTRFIELGIFAEDEEVPLDIVANLWRETGNLSRPESQKLCQTLHGLSLLFLKSEAGGSVRLHDVLRDYIRGEIGERLLAATNAALMDAVSCSLPRQSNPAMPSLNVAWWEQAGGYMLDHSINHLLAAGRVLEAEALAGDLRWIEARLLHRGPTAPWSDLAMIPTAFAAARARDLARIAHLLQPVDPPSALRYILYSRLEPVEEWRAQVAARKNEQPSGPMLVNIWPPPDLPDPALLRTIGAEYGGEIRLMDAAPDGKWLAVAGELGVHIWEVSSGRLLAQIEVPDPTALRFFPDGSQVVFASEAEVKVWSPVRGDLKPLDTGVSSIVRAMDVAPNGAWVAVGYDDGVRLIDANTSSIVSRLECDWVTSVAISPDASWIVTGNANGEVQVWETTTGAISHTLPRRRGVVRSVAVAPSGNWCAAASGDGVQIWTSGSDEFQEYSYEDLGAARQIFISSDSAWLAVSGGNATSHILDAGSLRPRTSLTENRGFIRTAAAAPDGAWIATGGSVIRIWDRISSSEPRSAPTAEASVRQVVAAPAGDILATVNVNGQVCIRSQSTGGLITRFEHPVRIERLVFSHDATWLATVGEEGVRLWDTSGVLLETLTEVGFLRAVTITSDGTRIIAGGEEGKVYIWNRLGMLVEQFVTGPRTVRSIAVSPDGRWLATGEGEGFDSMGGGKAVQIWRLNPDSSVVSIAEFSDGSQELSVTPDGVWLVGLDGSHVKVRDIATGQIFPVFGESSTKPAYSPAGTWMATVYQGRTIRIWNWMDGALVTVLRTEGLLADLCWSADGTVLFACGEWGVYSFRFVP
ncbi:NB-ARC domain-containing protein [Streptomyces sp. NPDC057099]|uniref:NB-ARC domain-containing protein n=1 Tax=Streptomyces sp. NPDC057099 TaxID=3346019 RepID=UPI0036282236